MEIYLVCRFQEGKGYSPVQAFEDEQLAHAFAFQCQQENHWLSRQAALLKNDEVPENVDWLFDRLDGATEYRGDESDLYEYLITSAELTTFTPTMESKLQRQYNASE